MSKKANPTIIGAFILGAIALIVLSLILVGGGKIFSERQVYVTYFEGSLRGLRAGANVTFRGVRVGQVRELYVRFNENTLEFDSPVVIELEDGAIRTTELDEMRTQSDADELFSQLIEKGLRAQLQMESFVTGQLLVDLDYHPNTKAMFRDKDKQYREIPTVPNDVQIVLANFQNFFAQLKDVPFDEIFRDLKKSIHGIEQIVNSPELAHTLKGIDKFVNSVDTQQLTSNLTNTIEDLDTTIANIQSLVKNFDKQVDPLAINLNETMDDFQAAVLEIQNTSKEVRILLQDQGLRSELSDAIIEFANAARSFRVLVELLERHPESFISGKPDSQ